MLIIGLTGSIGMGKTATGNLFRQAGAPVHDSDAAVHELYRGELGAVIAEAFPPAMTPVGIDRQILGKLVLGDAIALRRLEAIVHPRASAHRREFLLANREAGRRIVICDIPLLFEAGLEPSVDLVVVVSAPLSVQKARVLARPAMTEERFAAIMKKQMDDAQKRRLAHAVIETGYGHEAARRQVQNLMRAVSGLSGRVMG